MASAVGRAHFMLRGVSRAHLRSLSPDWELVRMATMVNHTSRTLVMSAVPNVTRTKYCIAAETCASTGVP